MSEAHEDAATVVAPVLRNGVLADFDHSQIYVDEFTADPDLVDKTNPKIHMDDLLKTFLCKATGIESVYVSTILEPSGIRDYPSFHELMVQTSRFQDLEHIYTALGPNALGLYYRTTRKLLLLGVYLQRQGVTLFETKSGTFLPGVFNFNDWQRFCTRRTRYEFEQRFKQASSVTFLRHEASLRVDASSVPRTFVDMNTPTSERYDDSLEAREETWSRLTRTYTGSPKHDLPLNAGDPGMPLGHFSSSLRSIAKDLSDDAINVGLHGGERRPRDNVDGLHLPTSLVRLQTKTDAPSDPSDGSSWGTSSDSSSASGSSDSGTSGDSSDSVSNGSGDSGTDPSSDNDATSDGNSGSSFGSDDSPSTTESRDGSSTGSSSSDGYRAPRSAGSFMRRIRKYEQKDRKKKKNSKSSKKKNKRLTARMPGVGNILVA